MPLELKNNFYLYANIKFKSRKELLDTLRILGKSSLLMYVYPMEKEELFLTILVNNRSLPLIFNQFSKKRVKRVLFLQHEKSLPLLTSDNFCKFKYSASFDPKKLRWQN